MPDSWPPKDGWLDQETTPSMPATREPRRERRRRMLSDALSEIKQEIGDLRHEQDNFRDDFQRKLARLEKWAAVQEERTITDRAKAAGQARFLTWGISILLTLVGILLPLLLSKQ